MIYLPDTNACITLLRQKNPALIARWKAVRPADIAFVQSSCTSFTTVRNAL